jgi:hypothetical protein
MMERLFLQPLSSLVKPILGSLDARFYSKKVGYKD